MTETALSGKPQINISPSTAGKMRLVFFCASLVVLQSAFSDSGASLIVALTALCAAILTELLCTLRVHGFAKIQDGSAAVSAMVLALLLPNRIPPLYAALGAVFSIAVVKHSFGGLGAHWLNPALGGWLFIRCAWPDAFAAALEGSPLESAAALLQGGLSSPVSPMNLFSAGGALVPEGGFDAAATSFFNKALFPLFGTELPPGYAGLLVSKAPGIIADRGLLALLFGTIIIAASQFSRSWLPAVYLAVFGFLVRVFGDIPFEGHLWNGDVLFSFFTGGTFVAAFIIAADPAGSAKSGWGMLAVVMLSAVLAYIFRYGGFEFYGCFFAAAFMNALCPLVRHFEYVRLYSRRRGESLSGAEAGR